MSEPRLNRKVWENVDHSYPGDKVVAGVILAVIIGVALAVAVILAAAIWLPS